MLHLTVLESKAILSDRYKLLANGLVLSLIVSVTLVLEVGLLQHTEEYDKKDGDQRGQRRIGRHCGKELNDSVHRKEAHHDLFVLQEQGDWNECKWAETRRFHFVRGGLLLLFARPESLVLGHGRVNSRQN